MSTPIVAPNTSSLSYRGQQLLLWFLCAVLVPIFLVVMLIQILFGAAQRAHYMAISFDEAGNCAFGGDPTQTMSARVGDAWIKGQKWADYVAPIIDFFFGKGHCLSNVDLPEADLTPEQIQSVNDADTEQGDTPTYK